MVADDTLRHVKSERIKEYARSSRVFLLIRFFKWKRNKAQDIGDVIFYMRN